MTPLKRMVKVQILVRSIKAPIFYNSEAQKITAEKLIDLLKAKGLDIATELIAAEVFYPAESYHQDYYETKGGTPYCHGYRSLF